MTDKTVLITGCSTGGIGSALAKEFHAKGLRVFATSRTVESMQDLSALGIEVLSLDVTDIQAIRSTRDEIATRTGGKLDILVNNAGHAYPVAAIDMDMSAVRALFEVNLFAPICMVQEFVSLLIASGRGCIVNIGSVSGIMPVPFSAAYNTSKAALHAFGNTLRVELAPFDINVLNVITGGVKSNIVKPHTIPDTSLYKSMEQVYQKQRITVSQQDATHTAEYARTVVAEAIKTRPRAWLWTAKNALLCWLVDTFLWRTAFDWFMQKKFGFLAFSLNLRGRAKDKRV
ncbi:NAD-P-binding protein [Roridomyces roridus]|uniref:NAD-P-binding protein n=1 Tax=Roridomyces roridus TaxID=1738132 RepID=A0AAD7BXA1_9AGAR|nr:NAD-P-binding protein [Roridomyces roridus]